MKISINPYDPKSIQKAIKLLEDYKKDFRVKEERFVKRLADIGVSVARAGFLTADYDGDNDVQVSMTHSGTKATVTAFGETVGFIEFGTGVKFPEWDSSGMDYTPPKHGTYGKGQGNNPHGWYFRVSDGARARHTYGNQPADAMLTAREEMIERVMMIAREVWK